MRLDVNTEKETRNYTLPLYGMRGEFSLSGDVRVPYFTTLMDLKRVTSEIKTHEEVSPSLDTVYSLRELFQRRIDSERVRRDLVNGYLRVQTKLKFFNSLTIVLLPKSPDGKISRDFENYENNDPVIPDSRASSFDGSFSQNDPTIKKVVFGGVQLVTTKAADISRLCWDRARVDAVAVDGQHRLKALKLWMEEKNHSLSSIEEATRIPIIFLLLHPAAGFKGGAAREQSGIKGISREIFTDLNKNAKEVDLATTIILDDLSLEARCARSLVTDSTCEDSNTALPLSLLRWQEPNNRFDTHYYLNSIVNLYSIVQDLLNLKRIDPMDHDEAMDFINSVQATLGSGEKRALVFEGVSLLEHYQSNYFDKEEQIQIAPFSSLPPQYIATAVEGFKSRFAPWLVKLLRGFKPYRLVLEYSTNNQLITGDFAHFLSQPQAHRESTLTKELQAKYQDNWHEIVIGRHIEAIESIKKVGDKGLGEQWAFKAVFQKAVVKLAAQIEVGVADDERARLGSIDDVIDFLDALYDKDILRVQAPLDNSEFGLWAFIATNPGSKNIKVTRRTEVRIFALLCLWYYSQRYLRQEEKTLIFEGEEGDGQISPQTLIRELKKNSSKLQWPSLGNSIEELDDLFRSSSVAVYLKVGRGEPSDKEIKRNAANRLESLLIAGLAAL